MPLEGEDDPSSKPWTREQWLGITLTGRSLLVSAAAGSGKTSVLAQRCVHLVCDTEKPCEVDELLVVTFTEDAATEMRARVTQALRDRHAQSPSEHLLKQLALIDQAQISTLHAFCSRVLRQNFHLAGLDPAFKVMNADEARLLRREVANDLFERRYDDETGEFQSLIDGYGQGNDERVREQLLHVYELLTSIVDRDGWIARSRQRIIDAIHVPLEQSESGDELLRMIDRSLATVESRCIQTAEKVDRLGVTPYAKHLRNVGDIVGIWRQEFQASGIDRLAELVKTAQWPRLPTIRGEVAHKELAKFLVESVMKFAKDGEWRNILRFSTAQWKEGLSKMLPHAETFLGLVEQFTHDYRQAKRAVRAVDFADLERFTLQVLSQSDGLATGVAASLKPSGAALTYHRRFAHVLVDEYQDINEVQDAILSLVSRECLMTKAGADDRAPGCADSLSAELGGEGVRGEGPSVKPSGIDSTSKTRPSPQPSPADTGEREPERFVSSLLAYANSSTANLFCVGDVKQSIYRFRLAEPGRFLERERQFRSVGSHGQVIALQANFRSRAPLLEAINSVFYRLMTSDAVDIEYDQSHRLIGKIAYPAIETGRTFRGAPLTCICFPRICPATIQTIRLRTEKRRNRAIPKNWTSPSARRFSRHGRFDASSDLTARSRCRSWKRGLAPYSPAPPGFETSWCCSAR